MATRVLHLLSQRPGWTGSGVALDAIVRTADKAGHEQLVVIGTRPDNPTPSVGALPDKLIRPLIFERGLLDFPLPGMSDVMPYSSSQFSKLTHKQLSAYRAAWRRHIEAAIVEFRPDVIHSHHIWLMSSMLKDIASNTPIVTHCHGTGLRQLSLCPHLADEVRRGCSRNNAFFALHQGQADTIARELEVDANRIHVIGSGYRDEVFHDAERPSNCGKVVTYAGKLSHAKGVPWLLKAVEQVRQLVPDVKLHIAGAGTGAEADTIRKQINASSHIVFHGQLTQQELGDLFRRSAVFVLPSFYEGLPLVLVEAAACGCHLVATELPGVINQLKPQLGEALDLVPLPRLVTIDRPVTEDLSRFVNDLTKAIARSLLQAAPVNPHQSVANSTWQAVFGRVECVWKAIQA